MRIFAHGIGGAKDLPIPAEYAIAGACAALAVSFTVLALAWREPRFNVDARGPTPGPGVDRDHRRRPVVRAAAAGARLRVLPVRRCRRDLRQGPADQPVLRGVLRPALGRHRADVPVLRPVLQGGQPGADDQRAAGPAVRLRPRRRPAGVPRPARLLAGRARAVRVRVVRARLPVQHRARSRPPVVRGVRRGDADRRRGVRQPVLRERRPVRGVLLPRRPAVAVGSRRRREPRRTLPARQPGPHPGAARTAGGLLGAARQHGVRLVQGLRLLDPADPVVGGR